MTLFRFDSPIVRLSFLLALFFLNSQPASAEWELVDNFDSWSIGSIDGQGEWVINDFGSLSTDAFEVAADGTDATNQVLVAVETAGNESATEDGFLQLANPLEDGATGTLFFRFRASDPASHVNFGLSDVDEPTGTWNHFEAQIRDNQNGGLDFRGGGGFSNVLEDLPLDEWISVWMVIDNANDLSINYIQSETEFSEQEMLDSEDGEEFPFRNGTDEALSNFYMRSGANHTGDWYLDDIYLDLDGQNLTIPTLPSDPLARLDDGSLTDGQERADYVHDVLGTWLGDSNVDGEFNSLDFVTVFQAGEYEDDVAGNSSWATGDWNGDMDFDSGDLVVAFQDGGFEVGPRAAVNAVPEPASLILILTALMFVPRRR